MSDEPLARLGLPAGATQAEVEARWRELRSQHHPDKGGDAETFHELNLAYQQALREAPAQRPCPVCAGAGRTEVRRGFDAIKLLCQACRGSGVES